MIINKTQENILKYVKVLNNIKDIAIATKQTEMKVQTTIVTLYKKNKISKEKASQLLKDTNSIKFIDINTSGLSRPLTTKSDKFVSTIN